MRSIAARFAITAGLVGGTIFLVMVTVIGMMSAKQSRDAAGTILTETAYHHARQIEKEIGMAMNTSRGLATLIESAIKDRPNINRDFLNHYIQAALNINPFFFGTWVMVDPFKLEGNDSVECTDGQGLPGTIFCPYAYRDADSIIFELGTFFDALENDYYRISHSTGKPGLIDPYIDPDAENAIMTSTTVPIFDNGQIAGVAGIDLNLQSFNTKMRQICPYKDGQAFLIGNNGLIVGHRIDSISGKSASIMGISEDVLQAIQKGIQVDKTIYYQPENVKSRFVSVPVRVDQEAAPWALAICVPESVLLKETIKQVLMNTFFAVIGVILLLLGLLFAGYKISLPIKRVVAQLKEISSGEGDLTKRIPHPTNDEIGMLADSFNAFCEKISEIILHIKNYASTFDKTSNEFMISSGNLVRHGDDIMNHSRDAADSSKAAAKSITNISSNTQDMSGNLNMIAAAVEQINASLSDVARNCQLELQIAASANFNAQSTKEKLISMSTSADEIAQVTSLVNKISDKINLLALNARIEAVKAGEYGLGFSIVAQEVKALSFQTSDAIKKINNVITNMRTSSKQSIEVIMNIYEDIEKVVHISKSIAASINEQSTAVKEISNSMNNADISAKLIAQSVSNSASELVNISSTFDNISNSVQNMTDKIKTIEKSSHELASLSSDQQKLVERFHI